MPTGGSRRSRSSFSRSRAAGSAQPTPDALQGASGVIYLTPEARFAHLLALPEGANLGRALNGAMDDIEKNNPDLADALPKNYGAVGDDILRELIKTLAPVNIDGDAFGRVYEYFMGSFAMQEMQKGGEFYTPSSIVKLIVEIIEPYHGRILDPACGSGGMFVHSADFVRAHKREAAKELSIFGIEKVSETQRLARMNLAVHGLGGTIREANAYYEEPFPIVGQFDFVMANPPFNVDGVDKEKDAIRKRQDRFPFGLPKPDNGNYLWIEMFWSALNDDGPRRLRHGQFRGRRARDRTRHPQGPDRERDGRLHRLGRAELLLHRHAALHALVPRQGQGEDGAERSRSCSSTRVHVFRQIDRAHRDFTPAQIEFLANIVRLWRGEPMELLHGSFDLLDARGLTKAYADVPGLCKAAS